MQQDRVLREREASATTGLAQRTLQRYRALGIGPTYVRVGLRAVGYVESDLALWLEGRRNLPSSPHCKI